MWAVGVIVYVILSGTHPFSIRGQNGPNDMHMLRRICRGQYEFRPEYWNKVSSAAKDFISKLLVVNPEQRLTAEQALQHPWFHDNSPLHDYLWFQDDAGEATNKYAELLSESQERLRTVQLKRKLQVAVYSQIMVNHCIALNSIYQSSEPSKKPRI